MTKGFTVSGGQEYSAEDSSLRTEAHLALDRIIDKMKEDMATAKEGDTIARGGEIELQVPCDDHIHTFRLTFCDFTDQKRCVWCNGTGVEGS